MSFVTPEIRMVESEKLGQQSATSTLKAIARAYPGKLFFTLSLVALENALLLAYPLFAGFAVDSIIRGDARSALFYAVIVLAFWAVGIDGAIFWGSVMTVLSIVPGIGAALVWVPAAMWLLLSGEIGRGLIMLVVGVFGISMVDNVLRPFLLSGKAQTSTLVIFFGLLGGVAAFGFIGLVVGPVILVTTGSLLKMFRDADSVDPLR